MCLLHNRIQHPNYPYNNADQRRKIELWCKKAQIQSWKKTKEEQTLACNSSAREAEAGVMASLRSACFQQENQAEQ